MTPLREMPKAEREAASAAQAAGMAAIRAYFGRGWSAMVWHRGRLGMEWEAAAFWERRIKISIHAPGETVEQAVRALFEGWDSMVAKQASGVEREP